VAARNSDLLAMMQKMMPLKATIQPKPLQVIRVVRVEYGGAVIPSCPRPAIIGGRHWT